MEIYPYLKKQIQHKSAQAKWNDVKESPETYEKLMVSLSKSCHAKIKQVSMSDQSSFERYPLVDLFM